MNTNIIQDKIGDVLDIYNLPDIRSLREKVVEFKEKDPQSREAQLLEFVIFIYEQDCDTQEGD